MADVATNAEHDTMATAKARGRNQCASWKALVRHAIGLVVPYTTSTSVLVRTAAEHGHAGRVGLDHSSGWRGEAFSEAGLPRSQNHEY